MNSDTHGSKLNEWIRWHRQCFGHTARVRANGRDRPLCRL